MTESNAAQLLAQVEKSPAAVAVHDKNAWLSIFAQYHIVEDPVGSTPHIGGIYDAKSAMRGNGALSRFFDTFIAPNRIRFEVAQDIVCDNHVVRDLTIHITMSDKVQVQVPMHLLYELTQERGEWKIVRLAAHWELMPMLSQLFGKGLAALPVMSALTVRMLKLQGLSGMLGFSKAVMNIGSTGKHGLTRFAAAFNRRSLSDLMAVCDNDAQIISWPNGEVSCSPSQLFDTIPGELELSHKILAAGDVITASAVWQRDGQQMSGVVIAGFNRKTGKITALRCYF